MTPTWTDEQINTYAGLKLSLRCEQTNGLERDWSDTAILMARQLLSERAQWKPTPEMKGRMIGTIEFPHNERYPAVRHIPWATIKDIVAAWHKHAKALEAQR